MSENNELRGSKVKQSANDEIDLFRYLLIVAHYKKRVFLVTVLTFFLMCGITLLMPNIYTSTARILPSQENQGGLGSMLSGGGAGLASLVGLSSQVSSSAAYVAMLKSRTISEAVIERLDLMNKFQWQSRTIAYNSIRNKIEVSIGKWDRIITITMSDKDPELASKIVNTYVDELQKFHAKRSLKSAGKERIFLEKRLLEVKADLADSEEALKAFQEKNKAIRIDAQASAIIEAISQLKGQLANREVELGVLLSSQTENNPQVISIRESIAQIKNQINRLESAPDAASDSDDIFLATSEVPELGLRYARLLRDFKVQESIYELLIKQYEIAKINEKRETSVIQVLDAAIPADSKSKPRRSVIVLFVTFSMGMCAVLFIVVRQLYFDFKSKI